MAITLYEWIRLFSFIYWYQMSLNLLLTMKMHLLTLNTKRILDQLQSDLFGSTPIWIQLPHGFEWLSLHFLNVLIFLTFFWLKTFKIATPLAMLLWYKIVVKGWVNFNVFNLERLQLLILEDINWQCRKQQYKSFYFLNLDKDKY